MSNDSLGDRMKRYEAIPRLSLYPRTPVLLRLDGRAFHTYTKGMERPYDERFHECMWATAQKLCDEIAGCRLAYVQSDEITLLLTDYRKHTTQPWFDYSLQKVVSVAAGLASVSFYMAADLSGLQGRGMPHFDCRAWNLPKEEVCNAFIWRQQDATRNSISMLALAHFSQKRLHGVDSKGMQDLLMLEKGINWNDCPTPQKRGVCVVRRAEAFTTPAGEHVTRWAWRPDFEIPIFTQRREYIERWLGFPEDD